MTYKIYKLTYFFIIALKTKHKAFYFYKKFSQK